MSDFYLVIVDTTGIQPYIFGSNRLRENVGASYLVHMATGGWLMQDPDDFLPASHNIDPTKSEGKQRLDKNIEENDDQMAELLYAGGGNTVLIFRRIEDAKDFGRKLSHRLLEKAPGLDAVMVIHPLKWPKTSADEKSLAAEMQAAMREMERKKNERAHSQPLQGLGVTAACASTGLAANYHETEPGTAQDEEKRKLSISAEVAAKWDNKKAAKERLENALCLPNGYTYSDEFDNLGRTEGEQSYIAVVHADGNNMGKIVEGITETFAHKSLAENRAYIQELRRFSDDANRVGLKALKAVVDHIAQWNQRGQELEQRDERSMPGEMALLPGAGVNEDTKTPETYVSIRPIVFGGDDVTFVCDGRIGLQAAKVFLDVFGQEPIYGEQAIACAGVAIVKVRYPFARAYQLAEVLSKSAKNTYDRKVPAIDWHLANSGLFGSLKQIRAEEYEVEEHQNSKKVTRSLLMRPLFVGKAADLPADIHTDEGNWRSWDNFAVQLQAFQQSPQNSPKGKWPRNKVMGLRMELANSRWNEPGKRDPLEQYIAQLQQPLPKISGGSEGYQKDGWMGDRCVYFDAIESIDQRIAYMPDATGETTEIEKEAAA
jgi:hypothetical protein